MRSKIGFLLVVTEPGSNCCRLKPPEEEKEDKQEQNVSRAAAKETWFDAAIAAVLSEPDSIFK